VKITLVSNNWTKRRGFIAEHGLSLMIYRQQKRVLFDTGQGLALPSNLASLKRSTREIDAIVLSHGHYDHGGALEWLLDEFEGKIPPLYAHPDAALPRYSRTHGPLRQIGVSDGTFTLSQWPSLKLSTEPIEVLPGLHLTGEIQPRHSEEFKESEFLLDRGKGLEADSFADDQALFTSTSEGLVVITGCAHSGVIATIERALALSGEKRVHTVIGGFHLVGASEARLEWTIEQFARLNPSFIVPLHCTGQVGICRLYSAFPQSVRLLGAGDCLEI